MSLYTETFECGGWWWIVGQRVRWRFSPDDPWKLHAATVSDPWCNDYLRLRLDAHGSVVTHASNVEPIPEGDLA